jgi:two-component system, NarL family, nitrate/nitrite response regulator NarL
MRTKLLLACWDMGLALATFEELARIQGMQIAGEATDMERVFARAAVTQPDVVLLEHRTTAEGRTWHAIGRLREACAHARFLLLCDAYTQLMIVGFVQRGVNGCLLKGTDPSLVAKAVTVAGRNHAWFGRNDLLEALRSRLDAAPIAVPDEPGEEEALTAREREILALIGNAMSNKEIARALKISDLTVKTHLHRIYVKLEKSGRYKAFLAPRAAMARSAAGDAIGASGKN